MLESIRNNAQSWGVKVAFGLIILVFVFWGVGSYRSDTTRAVAQVNDTPIMEKDYQRTLKQSLETMRSMNPNFQLDDETVDIFKNQVLQQMIRSALLEDAATEAGIDVSRIEMRREIGGQPAFRSSQDGKFSPEVYTQALRRQGFAPAEYEAMLKKNMQLSKLQEYVALAGDVSEAEAKDMYDFIQEARRIEFLPLEILDYSSKIEPTEEQIKEHYEHNQDAYTLPERAKIEYIPFTADELATTMPVSEDEITAFYETNGKQLFGVDERVKARHILITVPEDADEAVAAEAQAKIQDIHDRIQKGEPFEDLAKEYSDDPGSAADGGLLGWFGRGRMVPPFEETAFSMQPGELSEPVKTRFGWHLILVEAHEQPHVKPLDEVRAQVTEMIKDDKAAESLSTTLDQALEQVIAGQELDSLSKALSLPFKTSDLFSKANAGFVVNLTDEGAASVFDVPAGTIIDEPLEVKEGYILAKVVERRPSEVQPLEDIRKRVVQQVKERIGGEQAFEDAEKLLQAATTTGLPEDKRAELAMSETFNRQGIIAGLGKNEELTTAAYAAKVGDWLPQPYRMGGALVIARLAERIPPAQDVWERTREQFMGQLKQGRVNEVLQAYIQGLSDKADARILDPNLL